MPVFFLENVDSCKIREGLGDYLSATVWALYFRPDMKDWAILEDAVSRAWHTQESMILLDDTDHSHRLVWVL